jgi:L-proline amide hydrolase
MSDPHEHVVTWGDGHSTWAQVWPAVGERRGDPVIVSHGGPGMTHDYLRPLRALAEGGRDVILYDQVGNGRSSHYRDRLHDVDFWTVSLFVHEVEALVAHFDLDDGYHFLGQSWGGMLAIEWAIEPRTGLRSVILADSPSSMLTWAAETARLRSLLPVEVQATLAAHEAAGTTGSAEYAEATTEFYRRHLCRLDPWPDDLEATLAACDDDPTVYYSLIGPTEFHIVGAFASWDRDADLHRVAVPALVLHGEHDEATDLVVEASRRLIPGAEYVRVPDASHCPHLEQPELTLTAFSDFLAQHDSKHATRSI